MRPCWLPPAQIKKHICPLAASALQPLFLVRHSDFVIPLMSLSYKINVSGDDQVIKLLSRLRSSLVDRTELHKSIGSYAEMLTRQHLTTLAQTRHKTADKLGATPSGHLERAAESVTSLGDNDAAYVEITSPGIRRAFGDVTITAKEGKWLTIPATAEAYNRRARTFNDLRVAFFGKGRLALVKAEQSSLADRKESGGRSEVYYWLKKSVTQKQDRTLLPPDDDYTTAAVQGIKAYLRMLRTAAAMA